MPRTSSPASRTRRRPWAVELGDHRVHQGARDVHQAPRRAKRRALDHAAAVAETERKLEASDNLEIDLEGRSLEKPPRGEKNGFAQIVSRANSPAGVNRAARSSPVDLSHASVVCLRVAPPLSWPSASRRSWTSCGSRSPPSTHWVGSSSTATRCAPSSRSFNPAAARSSRLRSRR